MTTKQLINNLFTQDNFEIVSLYDNHAIIFVGNNIKLMIYNLGAGKFEVNYMSSVIDSNKHLELVYNVNEIRCKYEFFKAFATQDVLIAMNKINKVK